MKNIKHVLLAVCILMLAICLCFSSCGDKNKDTDTNSNVNNPNDSSTEDTNNGGGNTDDGHEHSYTASITKQPACDVAGETTYACSCGDSYTEAIDALGHDVEITVTKYPSANEKGSKTYTCEREGCTYSEVKEIESLLLSLPQASQLIAPLFNNNMYSVELSENSTIIGVTELSDYTQGELGEKNYIVIELCKAELGAQSDVLQGAVEFKFHLACADIDGTLKPEEISEPEDSFHFGSLFLYINGDDISVEYTNAYDGEEADTLDEDYKANQLIAMALGSVFPNGYKNALALMNIGIELKTYIPLLEGIVTSTGALLMPEYLVSNIQLFAALFGDAIISEDVDENGNTVYTLDIIAVNEFLKEYTDASIAEILDAQYGESTTEALVEFINSIPDMKLKDIALSAIAFAENYGVNVETTYELVNYIIYLSTGEMMDVEEQIEARHDSALAQVLAELVGNGAVDFDSDSFIKNMKSSITSFTSTVPSYTIDDLYNLIANGNPDYIPEGETEEYSITALIHKYIAQLDNVVSVTVTTDTEGTVLSVLVNAGPLALTYTNDVNGNYLVSVALNGEEMFNGTLALDENGFAINGMLVANGTTVKLSATLNGDALAVSLSQNDEVIFTIDATLNTENGTISDATLKVYGYETEYDNEGNEIGEKYGLFITLAFESNEDGTYTIVSTTDDSKATIIVTLAEGEIKASFEILDTELNKLDAKFNFTFKYELDENGMPTYLAYIMDGYGYDNYNNTSDHIYYKLEMSQSELHMIMKQNADEYMKVDIVSKDGVLTQADIVLNVTSYEYDPDLDYSVSVLVNAFTLKYAYDADTSVGSLFVDIPSRCVNVVVGYDADSLNAKLVDTRKDEAYNNNVLLELNVELDANGAIKLVAIDINIYEIGFDKITETETVVFVDMFNLTLTNDEGCTELDFVNHLDDFNGNVTLDKFDNGIKLDWYLEEYDEALFDGVITLTTTENSTTIDLDIAKHIQIFGTRSSETQVDTMRPIEGAGGYVEKDDEEYYEETIEIDRSFYVIIDTTITFTVKEAE